MESIKELKSIFYDDNFVEDYAVNSMKYDFTEKVFFIELFMPEGNINEIRFEEVKNVKMPIIDEWMELEIVNSNFKIERGYHKINLVFLLGSGLPSMEIELSFKRAIVTPH